MEDRQASATGSGRTAEELLPLVYDRLRRLARSYLRNEGASLSLRPTDLVHETYLALVQVEKIDWVGKTHFFAMAARQMRRVLVDHARKRRARKRGGSVEIIPLNEDVLSDSATSLEVLALDEAMEKLGQTHQRLVQVAELRLFAGLKITEIAEALGVSPRTVRDDWRYARACLARDLGRGRKVKE